MTIKNRIECRRMRHMLWDYAQERLSEGPLEAVERHLTCCARCRAELSQARNAAKLLTAYNKQENARPKTGWMELRDQLIAEPVTYMRTAPAPMPAPRRLVLGGAAATLLITGLVVGRGMFSVAPSHHVTQEPVPAVAQSHTASPQLSVADNNPGDGDVNEALTLAAFADPEPAEHVVKPVVMHVSVPSVPVHLSIRRSHSYTGSFKHVNTGHAAVKRSIPAPDSDTGAGSSSVPDLQTVSMETQTTSPVIPASQDDEPE